MTTSSSELKRSLSMSQLIFMGLVFIGPLAPIGIFGTLDAKSNGAVATVYLVATFALALTGSSYMRMSAKYLALTQSSLTLTPALVRAPATLPAG